MINQIAVIGAGTMGNGIALSFAINGYQVRIYESYEPNRNNAINVISSAMALMVTEELLADNLAQKAISNIEICSDLHYAVSTAEYVIEAISEDIHQKNALFMQLDEYCLPEAVIASNTSSISLGEMLKAVSPERREHMMICHWYNPAHLMPLVELSYYGNMKEAVFKKVEALYASIQKITVKVLKDVPGMVANRLQHSLVRQAFALIDEGICSPEDADRALMYSSAFRYMTTGIFQAADMGGLDIWYSTQKNLLPELANNTVPSPLLQQKVSEGKLGLKTGEGFFTYPSKQANQLQDDYQKRLISMVKFVNRVKE